MENKEINKIYSPLSIKYALKMLEEGALGNTQTQIRNAMGSVNLTKYKNVEEKLSLANALYINELYKDNINRKYEVMMYPDIYTVQNINIVPTLNVGGFYYGS